MRWNSRYQGKMKMKNVFALFVILLLTGGCVQVGQHPAGSSPAIASTVVLEPSETFYLLNCVSELQGLKQKEFNRYYREAANSLKKGDDRDTLWFICLSLNSRADYKQFKKGKKVFGQYLEEHPYTSSDMQGMFVLVSRLDQARINRLVSRKKLLAERDALAAEIESLQLESKHDKGRIRELQNQIDQLKNIEHIIKNREH